MQLSPREMLARLMELSPRETRQLIADLQDTAAALNVELVAYRPGSLIEKAAILYRDRRSRERQFGASSDLFREPAWDMLLALYVADDRPLSIKSASIAANVPASTALRWIDQLRKSGLIGLTDDPSDGRRRHLSLSPEGTAMMERYLTCI